MSIFVPTPRTVFFWTLVALVVPRLPVVADDSPSSVAGSLTAKYAVDRSGAMSYTIPLSVPPGTGGMKPSLALSYSSQVSAGTIGMGWTLTGMSSIQRCPATLDQDGFRCGVNYDANDRFCLDGLRLVNISTGPSTGGACHVEPDDDPYYTADAVYHTEKESWKQVTAVDSIDGTPCGSGPCAFEVTDRSGRTFAYGSPGDAADPYGSRVLVADSDTVRSWALDTVTDLNGNAMQLYYTQNPLASACDASLGVDGYCPCGDGGSGAGDPTSSEYDPDPTETSYPCRIAYTTNDDAGLSAQREVLFAYAARDATDQILQYGAGNQVTTSARLSGVVTRIVPPGSSDWALVKAVAVGADDTEQRTTFRTRVASLTEIGSDGTSTLPATTFDYDDAELTLTQVGNSSFQTGKDCSASGLDQGWGDFNADGLVDWLCTDADDGQVWVALSVADDLDSLGQIRAVPCTGEGGARVDWADLDGDGADDWLCYGYDTSGDDGQIEILLSTGIGLDSEVIAYPSTPSLACTDDWDWVDFNGDGRVDWVCQQQDRDDSDNWDLYVFLTTGSGSSWTLTPLGDDTGRVVTDVECDGDSTSTWIDFDGDGLKDWVCYDVGGEHGTVTVLHSTGSGLVNLSTNASGTLDSTEATCDPSSQLISWTDFNGDGTTDWVCSGGGSTFVLLSTGLDLVSPTFAEDGQTSQSGDCDVSSLQLDWSDLNGDTTNDWICTGSGTIWVQLSTGNDVTAPYGMAASGELQDSSLTCTSPVFWGDFTGDGVSDWICSDTSAGTVAVYTAPGFADLATTITNGFGGQVEPTYAAMTAPCDDGDSCTYVITSDDASDGNEPRRLFNPRTNGQYPYAQVQNTLFLVADLVESDGQGNRYETSYSYADGLYDLGGRGWLGFATKTRTDEQLEARTITTFNQSFPFDGTVAGKQRSGCGASVTALGCGGATCSSSDVVELGNEYRAYLCQDVDADDSSGDTSGNACSTDTTFMPYDGVYQVLQVMRRTDHYAYGDYVLSLGEQYGYDSWGNRVQTCDWNTLTSADWDYGDYSTTCDGSQDWNSTEADDVYTASRYFNSQDDWLLGFVELVTVSSDLAGDDVLRQTRRSYDYPSDAESNATCAPAGWSYGGTMKRLCDGRWRDQAGGSCGSDDTWLDTLYTRDAYGNRVAVTDAEGNTTTIDYDSTYFTFPASVTTPPNAQGDSWTLQQGHDAAFGVQVSRTDANDSSTLWCYDVFGRRSAKQGPIASNASDDVTPDTNCLGQTPAATGGIDQAGSETVVDLVTTAWVEESSGTRTKETQWRNTWQGDDWKIRQDDLDGFSRTIKTSISGTDQATPIEEDTDYFTLHLVSERTVRHFQGDTAPPSNRCYDSAGRVTQATEPYQQEDGSDATLQTWSYSGSSEARTLSIVETQAAGTGDAWSRTSTFGFSASKRRLLSTVAHNDDDATTSYTYDRLGRVTQITDPIGATTTFSYNTMDHKLTMVDSDLGSTSYCYNDNDLLARQTDALSQVVSTDYDNLRRKVTRTYADAEGVVDQTVLLTWDSGSGANLALRLATIEVDDAEDSAGDSSYDYSYDDYGRQSQRILTFAGSRYTVGFDRDPLGRTTTRTYPDGSTVDQSYDSVGFLAGQTLTEPTTGAVAEITYDDFIALGRPQTVRYGDADAPGTTATFSYWPLAKLQAQTVTGASSTTLLENSTTWDRLHGLCASSSISGETDYGYADDDRGCAGSASGDSDGNTQRLLSAGDASFAYDQGGNLTVKDGVSYSYYAGSHRIRAATSGSAYAATYDANGNLTSKTAGDGTRWTYAYDTRNRLIEATSAAGTTTFLYDYRDRRLQKTETDGDVVTYVDPGYELYSSGGDTESVRYIQRRRGPRASLSLDGSSSASIAYFQLDQVDSVILATDESGDAIASVTYAPYGSIDDGASSNPDDLSYTFGSHQLDRDTGLYYMKARYYDPEVGRFLTADTSLGGGSLQQDTRNRYAFVLNSPVSYSDPTGHNIWERVGMGALAVGEIAAGLALEDVCSVCGSALVGAGIGGLSYDITAGKHFRQSEYWKSEAVGAVAGVVTGGIGELTGDGLPLAMEIMEGAGEGAAGDVVGQMTDNVLSGHANPFHDFDWKSVAAGAVGGAAAAGLSNGIQNRGSSSFTAKMLKRLVAGTAGGATGQLAYSLMSGREAFDPISFTVSVVAESIPGGATLTERLYGRSPDQEIDVELGLMGTDESNGGTSSVDDGDHPKTE